VSDRPRLAWSGACPEAGAAAAAAGPPSGAWPASATSVAHPAPAIANAAIMAVSVFLYIFIPTGLVMLERYDRGLNAL
jgi:hypothetical protein